MPKPNSLTQGFEQTLPRRRKRTAKAAETRTINTHHAGRALVAGQFRPAVQEALLRIMAAEQETTVQALLAEVLNMLFAKHHKPEIATVAGRD